MPQNHSGGYQLGHDAVAQAISQAKSHFEQKRQLIESQNQSEITVLQTRQQHLLDARRHLLRHVEVLLHRAQQSPIVRAGTWSLTIVVSLVVGAFILTAKTLEPFNLGWQRWIISVGVALVPLYVLDRFQEEFPHRAVTRVLVVAALAASLAMALLFGGLRGDVLAWNLTVEPVILLDSLGDTGPHGRSGHAEEMSAKLSFIWGLAAVAFELAAALALHNYRKGRQAFNSGMLRQLQKELLKVEKELLRVTERLHQLLSEAVDFEGGFWTDLRRGIHDAISKIFSSRKIVPFVLGGILAANSLPGADELHIVTGIDLSKTQNVAVYNGESEFTEAVQGVGMILGSVPTGTRLTVLGITNRSYVNPFILLEARTALDAGPFASHLASARRTLVTEWRKRSESLEPSFDETDLLGTLRFAGEVFAHSEAQRKVLAVFSDGRNCTDELDLETPHTIDVPASIRRVDKLELFANLAGVEVYLLGAGDHTGKRGTAYAVGLNRFWAEFVERSGGTLQVFSTTREVEVLRAALFSTR